MGIDHRGTDILVTEEFLDGPDVVAVLKQMGPESKAEVGSEYYFATSTPRLDGMAAKVHVLPHSFLDWLWRGPERTSPKERECLPDYWSLFSKSRSIRARGRAASWARRADVPGTRCSGCPLLLVAMGQRNG